MGWLALHIEAALLEYARRNPSFSDRDGILALEYAKDSVGKGRSRLLLTQDGSKIRNEAGEAILLSLEQCRFQKKIILLQDMERYALDEKLKCLENVTLRIKHLARGNLAGQAYLQDLAQRLDRLKGLSDQKKIITQA